MRLQKKGKFIAPFRNRTPKDPARTQWTWNMRTVSGRTFPQTVIAKWTGAYGIEKFLTAFVEAWHWSIVGMFKKKLCYSSYPIRLNRFFMLFAPTSSEWLFGHLTCKQDRQCTYNTTSKRLPATNVAVEKQWVFHSLNLLTSVAVGMQHAMHMRHIVICGLSRSTIFFHVIS